MADDWLTYREAAERLGVSVEGVRQRAIRGRWQRTISNDKRALVCLPDGILDAVRSPSDRPNKPGVRSPSEQGSNAQTIRALQDLVEAWKERASAAEARLGAADAREAQHVADLVAERAQTAKAIAAFASLADRLDALAAERARPWWRRLAG
jgi:hypothetical protein